MPHPHPQAELEGANKEVARLKKQLQREQEAQRRKLEDKEAELARAQDALEVRARAWLGVGKRHGCLSRLHTPTSCC